MSLVRSGEYGTAELADLSGMARSNVHRAIERQRDHATVGLAGDIGVVAVEEGGEGFGGEGAVVGGVGEGVCDGNVGG
ncbi:MAG: hypothetical protein ACRDX8_14540 [Acidimicrobiales bacterium]